MNNSERTKHMSDWIHEQEKARMKMDRERWERKRKEKQDAANTLHDGKLIKEKRKLGMI